MTPSQERELLKTIGEFIAAEIDRRVTGRIDALEKIIDQRRWVGVWATGRYHEGNMVTHDGSIWHANRETTSKPGDGDAWTLCVKRGRDGRDGKDGRDAVENVNVRRLQTTQRAG